METKIKYQSNKSLKEQAMSDYYIYNKFCPEQSFYNKYNDKQDILHYRKVEKRNISLCILYSILSLGLYFLFWHYEITNESNIFEKSKKIPRPIICVFLTIISFGLFLIYWSFRVSKQHLSWQKNNVNVSKKFKIYFVLTLLSILIYWLSLIVLASCFSDSLDLNLKLCLYIFSLLFYILSIVLKYAALAKMQYQLNYIIDFTYKKNHKATYIRNNNIFNRPYLSTILVIFCVDVVLSYVVVLYQFIVIVALQGPLAHFGLTSVDTLNELSNQLLSLFDNCDKPFPISIFLVQIFASLGVLLWFKMRFRKQRYKGVLGFKNILKGFLYALPAFCFLIFNFINANAANIKLGLIIFSFAPAFVEEITFRGIVIPNLLRTANRKYAIYVALFLPAVIFGGAHIINYFSGASLSITIYQILYTFFMGLILGAAFIRSGNLWPSIIFHFLLDFLAFTSDSAIQNGIVQTQEFEFSIMLIPVAFVALLCLFFALWLCRPQKHSKIFEVWDYKWGKAVIN